MSCDIIMVHVDIVDLETVMQVMKSYSYNWSMMSHDHISLRVLQICYLENDRTAVLWLKWHLFTLFAVWAGTLNTCCSTSQCQCWVATCDQHQLVRTTSQW